MDTKHTPGPWRINAVMREYGNKLEIGHEEISVASVTVTGKGNKTSITPEQDANACLIAAAPDMLDALERALIIVDTFRRVSGGDGDLTAAQARAAIAKAKGE